jgi:acyl-[acyl-carrier-protein] desaturase
MATNISHRRTATIAKTHGSTQLSKICGVIAADEARHAKAYKSFVGKIFEIDPSEMMLAFEDMMRKKIVMPAHFMRQQGEKIGQSWSHFSDAAQRLGVYTSIDYTQILESLIKDWNIESIGNLTGAAEKGRDYLMKLPERFRKVAERSNIKSPLEYKFNWIY